MKKILFRVLAVFLVIVSVLLAMYPFISNYLAEQKANQEVVIYEEQSNDIEKSRVEKILQEAKKYNDNLFGANYDIKFIEDFENGKPSEDYSKLLNPNGDGMMGYLSIPAIDLTLPIMHGTSVDTLNKAAGHLEKTSLPIGGKGTHAVITGHTGLPSAKLFTDLDQLILGDVFYINVLGKKLAYKVDKIQVVNPTETDALKIQSDKDYVTLITCTPYSLNTHRLFVRGKRIPIDEAQKLESAERKIESTWMREYKRALIIAAIVLVVILLIVYIIRKRLKSRYKKAQAEQA